MPATSHSKVTLNRNLTGYNLTDSTDFTTLVAGSGNGVKFSYAADDLVLLKNDTGGAAVFTFKVTSPGSFATFGVTVTHPTKSVAAGKTLLLRIADLFKDA